LWTKDLGSRAETSTVRTVNGGFRPLFFSSSPVTVSEFKGTLHVETIGSGQYVVFLGRAEREDGKMGEYIVVKDLPIRKDNFIVNDTVEWHM